MGGGGGVSLGWLGNNYSEEKDGIHLHSTHSTIWNMKKCNFKGAMQHEGFYACFKGIGSQYFRPFLVKNSTLAPCR